MGCDIHICTEVRTTVHAEKTWRSADHFKVNPYYGDGTESEYDLAPIYRDRHYALFSALAGVRSYSSEVEQISEPRGIPDDCSGHTKAQSDYWDGDGHSHSHCTLQNLYDYQDRNKSFRYSGMVSPEDAAAIDAGTGTPEKWCQGTSNNTWVHRTWEVEQDVMKELVEKLEERAKDEHWIFHSDERVPEEKAKETRIVFWFDN